MGVFLATSNVGRETVHELPRAMQSNLPVSSPYLNGSRLAFPLWWSSSRLRQQQQRAFDEWMNFIRFPLVLSLSLGREDHWIVNMPTFEQTSTKQSLTDIRPWWIMDLCGSVPGAMAMNHVFAARLVYDFVVVCLFSLVRGWQDRLPELGGKGSSQPALGWGSDTLCFVQSSHRKRFEALAQWEWVCERASLCGGKLGMPMGYKSLTPASQDAGSRTSFRTILDGNAEW